MKKYFFVVLLFLGFSCYDMDVEPDEDCVDADFSDCNLEEPFYSDSQIELSSDLPVEVYVFKDLVESNDTVRRFVPESSTESIELPIGNTYTAAAKYIRGVDTILVLDESEISKSSTSQCDSTCWTVSGADFDLRLKY